MKHLHSNSIHACDIAMFYVFIPCMNGRSNISPRLLGRSSPQTMDDRAFHCRAIMLFEEGWWEDIDHYYTTTTVQLPR